MIDFTELWEKTIQSQYGASDHLKGIIKAFAEQIDPNADIDSFYENIFDPETAKGVGLDIWGRIVGASRYLEVTNDEFFGFFGQLLKPMDQAPFINDGDTDLYRMSDEAFRKLIFIKAKANISDATLPSIKEMLTALFDSDEVTAINVVNAGNMKIRVIFTYYTQPFEIALFRKYGLYNVGAGVDVEYYQISPSQTFGFDGSGMQPFNQGVFAPYPIQET